MLLLTLILNEVRGHRFPWPLAAHQESLIREPASDGSVRSASDLIPSFDF